MNRTTYEITLTTDGAHKVTVTVEDPGGIDAALAYAQGTYAKLLTAGGKQTPMPVALVDAVPPFCPIHQESMTRMNGKHGPFWSCHRKNPDGNWCKYKPSL